MAKAAFTFRAEETLKSAFADAAKARDRTSAQLLRDFMRDFVRQRQEAAGHDAWFRRQVRAERDEADAGQLIPAEEVKAEAFVWRTETRGRLAGSARSG